MDKGTFRLFRCTGGIHVLAGGPSCFPGMGGGPPGPGEELFAGRPSWTQQKIVKGVLGPRIIHIRWKRNKVLS